MKSILFVPALFITIETAVAQTGSRKLSPDWYQIDSILKTIYKNDEPGLAIAIAQNGKPAFKTSIGITDLETKKRIDSNTLFNVGSLTKQFTAMAILQLAEKKKLSLSDKLSRFFPGMNKKVADIVTIQQLLTHSSGIIDHYGHVDTKNMTHAHNADVFNAIKNIDSTYFQPGSDYRYSNTAYCLLALIIEKLSGLTYSGYMKKNIFLPAGMKNTTVWNENEKIARKAIGYEYDATTNGFKRSDAGENIFFSTEGDGGLYTSVEDYLKWLTVLQTGKIVSKKIIAMARSPQFPVNKQAKLSYGYGWFIDENLSSRAVFHSGSNGGFRAYSFLIPDEGYMLVLFSNRTGVDFEKLASEINKILRPGP